MKFQKMMIGLLPTLAIAMPIAASAATAPAGTIPAPYTTHATVNILANDGSSAPSIGNPDGGTATNQTGSLTLDQVPDLVFENIMIGKTTDLPAKIKTPAQPTVQVTDVTGTGAGWHVNVTLSQFKSADGSKTFDGQTATISFDNPKITRIGTPATDAKLFPTSSNIVLADDSKAQTILNATAADQGRGSWSSEYSADNIKFNIADASQLLTDTYTADLTWELVSTPI